MGENTRFTEGGASYGRNEACLSIFQSELKFVLKPAKKWQCKRQLCGVKLGRNHWVFMHAFVSEMLTKMFRPALCHGFCFHRPRGGDG